MKFYCSLLLLLLCSGLYAQKKPVQGFVIDKDSKQRLAKVYIYNSRTDQGLYNNTKGEFTTQAVVGDTLFAALQGYAVDTLIYNGQNSVFFQLHPLFIRLKEVAIVGTKPITPEEQYKKTQQEYKYATGRGSSKDLLNLGQRGVGLGIDAIYNLLSRKGKNARHLQEILERDYKEQLIDFKFKPDYVSQVLGIKEPELTDFMQQYRPSYVFVLSASEYAFIVYLRNSYAAYKRNPKALRLQPLPDVKIDNL